MCKYFLHLSDEASNASLAGSCFIEAVENGFNTISRECGIDNAAGYHLLSVSAEYASEILGGAGGAVLTITAQGSEALVNYDEEKDPPKTYTAWISGVTNEELPSKYFFEIKETEPFDPFNDGNLKSDAIKYGVVWALIDELGNKHTKIKPPRAQNLFITHSKRFPTLHTSNPAKFTQLLLTELDRLHLTKTNKSDKLMNRITDILSQITETTVTIDGLYILAMSKTRVYFDRFDQRETLFSLRTKTKKNQQQVAEESGISLRQYQRLERGESKIKKTAYSTVVKIAESLGVSPDELFK